MHSIWNIGLFCPVSVSLSLNAHVEMNTSITQSAMCRIGTCMKVQCSSLVVYHSGPLFHPFSIWRTGCFQQTGLHSSTVWAVNYAEWNAAFYCAISSLANCRDILLSAIWTKYCTDLESFLNILQFASIQSRFSFRRMSINSFSYKTDRIREGKSCPIATICGRPVCNLLR